jgi:hypothetical protein
LAAAPTPWYYSDLPNVLLLLLILATVVGPVLIYLHKRSKIPRLAFDGYFKTDEQMTASGRDETILPMPKLEGIKTV